MTKRGWFYLLLVVLYPLTVAALATLLHTGPGFIKVMAGAGTWCWLFYAWKLAKKKFPDPLKPPKVIV